MLMRINNITLTAKISNQPLNLFSISRKLWNCIYNPKRFNAIILRLRKPQTTSLVFRTGKIVIVGAKTPDDAKKGARKTARAIFLATTKEEQLKIFCIDVKIQNIVVSETLKYKPDLFAFMQSKRLFCVYEPETFSPAVLCYKNVKDSKLIANLFFTGKIVMTGSSNIAEMTEFLELLVRILLRFKK